MLKHGSSVQRAPQQAASRGGALLRQCGPQAFCRVGGAATGAAAGRLSTVVVQALHIDRRAHLERQWAVQQEREQRMAALDVSQGSNGSVLRVDDLEQLDELLERAGSNLVILLITSRTCGVCKDAVKRFESMCKDAAASRARVLFLQADVYNEYDHVSDVARWHKVRAVPTFLFLDHGAVVKRLSMRDIRGLTGSSDWIRSVMAADMRRLQAAFTEVLFKTAPGSRN